MTLVAVDVDYRSQGAMVAAVGFTAWTDAVPRWEVIHPIDQVAAYEPGAFYKRELPCVVAVIERTPEAATVVIVDGYVWLGDDKPGLGAYLHQATGLPVIGVAKTCFHSAQAVEVVRGTEARRPLYISTAGLDVWEAAECIAQMHGPHRIPTLLKYVDTLCRAAL
jgi:deoxyribonuclease V